MGNIKTHDIKQVAGLVHELHAGRVSADFGSNKALVDELKLNVSKTVRNKIAGYITRRARAGRGGRHGRS